MITIIESIKHGKRKGGGISCTKKGNRIEIEIEEGFIPQNLQSVKNFNKLIVSGDCRVIMKEYVVIQLSPSLDEIEKAGVFISEKKNSIMLYKFLNFHEQKDVEDVMKLIRENDIGHLVKFHFDKQPLNIEKSHYIYFMHYIDVDKNKEGVEATSIVKMNTRELTCHEIYYSHNEVIHFSICVNNLKKIDSES